MLELRPYQKEAVSAVLHEWDKGIKRTLLVMATGTGKTIVFSKIIEEKVKTGSRCLILAHREELLKQAQEKIWTASGLKTSIEKAELSSLHSWERITVGSVQSLSKKKRLEKFPRDYFDVIVVDEAHHALSPSYQKVLTYFDEACVLGVTATPDRGDLKNLGEYFESLAYEYNMARGIREGYLSPIKALSLPVEINFQGVKTVAGDYQAKAVAHQIEPYLEAIGDEMQRICLERKTVVFLPLIDTSKKLTAILNRKGFRAAEIDGNSMDREEILQSFDKGKLNVLCNAMLLTEGWDCPSVDTIVVLRPTKVRSLYSQMVGRGTRLYPGKDSLLLLDFLWLTDEHDLCHPVSLLSKDDEVIQKAQAIQKTEEKAKSLEELVEEAEKDVIEEREKSLAERLALNARKKKRLVNPMEFSIITKSMDLINYKPAFGWEMDKPSEKQLQYIENMGIDPSEVHSKGQASLFINTIKYRMDNGLATPKQINLLKKRGFQKVDLWSMEEATHMIARIAANHWKMPRGIYPEAYLPERLRA